MGTPREATTEGTRSVTRHDAALARLGKSPVGSLLRPGDDDYELARRVFNAMIDRPTGGTGAWRRGGEGPSSGVLSPRPEKAAKIAYLPPPPPPRRPARPRRHRRVPPRT